MKQVLSQECQPKAIGRLGEVWPRAQRGAAAGHGLVEPAERPIGFGQIGMIRRVAWIAGHRPGNQLDRSAVVALLVGDQTEQCRDSGCSVCWLRTAR